MNTFEIVSININSKKGEKKNQIPTAELKKDFGIIGDAHAGPGNRQVSLLAQESINKMKNKGALVQAGDFAENITTKGIHLFSLPLGTKLKLGKEIEVEVTQIGKDCHNKCAIYNQVGTCVMPQEGIFVKVLNGGMLQVGEQGQVTK